MYEKLRVNNQKHGGNAKCFGLVLGTVCSTYCDSTVPLYRAFSVAPHSSQWQQELINSHQIVLFHKKIGNISVLKIPKMQHNAVKVEHRQQW